MIRPVTQNDYQTWLNLAREVEDLFGPMADMKEFQDGIIDCIKNKNAWCTEDEKGNVTGIIALNKKNNEIEWLAVGEKYRDKKYGEKLLNKALEELKNNGEIIVQTFSAEIKKGLSARKLYKKNGFTDFKTAGKNPAGLETVIMIKEQNCKG